VKKLRVVGYILDRSPSRDVLVIALTENAIQQARVHNSPTVPAPWGAGGAVDVCCFLSALPLSRAFSLSLGAAWGVFSWAIRTFSL
jgi:hypothetical protein